MDEGRNDGGELASGAANESTVTFLSEVYGIDLSGLMFRRVCDGQLKLRIDDQSTNASSIQSGRFYNESYVQSSTTSFSRLS